MMEIIFFCGKLALIFIAILSVLTKLLNFSELKSKIGEVVPRRFSGLVLLLLALVELLIAALLASTEYVVNGLATMLVLFLMYTAYLVLAGRSAEEGCGCFGFNGYEKSSHKADLTRNGAILTLIVIMLTSSAEMGLSDGQVVKNFVSDHVHDVLAVIFAVFVALFIVLYDKFLVKVKKGSGPGAAEFMSRLSKRNIGKKAFDIKVADYVGNGRHLKEIIREDCNNIIVFLSSSCRTCRELFNDVKTWPSNSNHLIQQIIVILGTKTSGMYITEDNQYENVFYTSDFTALEDFYLQGTPSAVVLDGSGKIISPSVTGATYIKSLYKHYEEESNTEWQGIS